MLESLSIFLNGFGNAKISRSFVEIEAEDRFTPKHFWFTELFVFYFTTVIIK